MDARIWDLPSSGSCSFARPSAATAYPVDPPRVER